MSKNPLSKEQTAQIIERLYADANRLSWESLSDRERSDQYAKWLDDPNVGGLLLTKWSREKARVWLKDSPMKEYARALAGQGSYAKYVSVSTRGPLAIIEACLGRQWSMVPGTSSIKPLRCEATDGKHGVVLIWGPIKDFKHLLWAALDRNDVDEDQDIRIAIFDTQENPLDQVEWRRYERIGLRCGFTVLRVRV